MKKIFHVIIIFLFVFSTSMPAFAASGPDFWIGNDSIDVSDPLNWSGGSANQPPQSGDSLVFDAAGTAGTNLLYDVASSTINGITFNSDADPFDVAGSGSNIMTLTAPIANNSGNDEELGMIVAGAVSNTGTGLGSVILDGDIDSSVTAITENSLTSALAINGAINVNAGGTTLTITNGPSGDALFVDGGVTGAGNLTLNNNASTGTNLEIDANPINNTGIVTNSGTGTDGTTIDGGVGSNVTGITENSATSALTIESDPITVNAGGTTLIDTAGILTVTGGVTGSGDLILQNNTATDAALSFSLSSINNTGAITNNGTGSGLTEISGGIDSDVTGITENSASSDLIIDTNPITVNAGGTTLTVTATPGAGGLTVAGGIIGSGNLILNNNTATDDALSIPTNSINNSGTITNSGTGLGATEISGGIDSNVTGITEDSTTSALAIDTNPIAVNSSGTTMTDTLGALTVTGGVTGTGNLILQNNSGTDDALFFNTTSINNSGIITNSGTSGETEISGGIDSNVTGITEDSATSALAIDTAPITVNSASTTLTDTLGTLTVSGGVSGSGNLVLNNNSATAGGITLSTTSINNNGSITNSGTGTGSTIISAEIDSLVTNVIEDSINSSLVLSNASNNYSGPTRIDAGILQTTAVGAIPATSDVSISSGAALDLDDNSQTIGSLRGAGLVSSSAGGSMTLTAGDSSSTTFSGNFQDSSGTGSGTIALTTAGTGTLTLSGNNAYAGGTTIGSGSTLAVGNANALGTGTVTNQSGGTLNLGTTSLILGGAYTQAAGSILKLTVSSPSTFGSIMSTGIAAAVAAGSAINVTVAGSIPTNTIFDIINTGGTGIVGAAPSTVTSTGGRTTFTDSIVGNDLILTADTALSFTSLGSNRNSRAIGAVLDNMTSPSTDMSNVLLALNSATDAQITSALNTMGPQIDGGVVQNSAAALNNLVSTTLDRIQTSLDHPISDMPAGTGIPYGTGMSSGDESTPNGVWAKPYGSYLSQGTLQGVQGYDAWNAGTVIGYDRMITDSFLLGVSGGYAYGQVNSDANSAFTDINSAQGTIYAGYLDPNLNYFIDAAGSFAWNWYDDKRDINANTINRIAKSSYEGQQYGAYLDGGYKLNLGGGLAFTPLASVQWSHLTLPGYAETGAGSLDLNVDKQQYNVLESGAGASIAYPIQFNWGNLTPEIHAKWLYDYIGDRMVVTSSFTGGGGSFTSYGAKPSKMGENVGGKLSFNFNNDLSLIAAVDAALKDQFFSVYGSGTVRYKF